MHVAAQGCVQTLDSGLDLLWNLFHVQPGHRETGMPQLRLSVLGVAVSLEMCCTRAAHCLECEIRDARAPG